MRNKSKNEAVIISLITTKNRESFYTALKSVTSQTLKADFLIVVSDSDEKFVSREQKTTKAAGGIYLRERHNHANNYAGSLNMGIDYIVENMIIRHNLDVNQIYLATLDDDDHWRNNYLKECHNALDNFPDFVVTGLIYHTQAGAENLSIPQDLSIHSFLRGNPHIQGSNTFVKLSTLMKAGCFDESMPSTTDRDIFVRIMQQKPRFAVVNEHLVDVNATSSERITKNRTIKLEGLRYFYKKYHHLMTREDRQMFHQRNSKYFGISEEEIETTESSNQSITSNANSKDIRYNGRLIVGVIVTYEDGAKRLLNQLFYELNVNDTIVVLNNTCKEWNWYRLLPQTQRKQIIFVPNLSDKKMSIAESRQKLQEHIYYHVWKENDVCWLLDDDMELKQVMPDNREVQLDIREEIPNYQNKYDAVIGGYTNDPPLPLLSTLRLQLLDYCYSKMMTSNTNNDFLNSLPDNYYALTDSQYKHIEHPAYCDDIDVEKIFQGDTQSRRLVNNQADITEARNRGGNTIIFDKDLLLLPTCSLESRDITARRGDYFWVLSAKRIGYKICQGTFCTYHNREKKDFNLKDEMQKMLKDIIGSSMTKAIERTELSQEDLNGKKKIIATYMQELHKRLSHFILSYYRIIGLLHIANDKKYLPLFTEVELQYFVRQAIEYSDKSSSDAAFRKLLEQLDKAQNKIKLPFYRSVMCEYLDITDETLVDLGQGFEGCVFSDGKQTYKLFYDKDICLEFLKKVSKTFRDCDYLYELDFDIYKGFTIVSRKYEEKTEWGAPYASDLVKLLLFGKEHGFCISNIKPENFINTKSGLRYIDYGKDVVPFDERLFERTVERSFQVFRYYFLNDTDFKELISRSYEKTADDINSGLDVYKQMFETVYKEDIHDGKVISTIKSFNPQKILDYGAGKCKIANQLYKDGYNVDVYDINIHLMHKRAFKGIRIFEDTSQIQNGTYDVINCNQVLCWTEDKMVFSVLNNISRGLKPKGYLVLSICNPFFTDIQHTMLRGGGRKATYYDNSLFQEYTSKMKPIDGLEQHRPTEWYIRSLRRYGFDIIDSYETEGIDTDNAMAIGEHLVFVCQKVGEYVPMNDLSLLVKTCAMDADNIYENIRHIVSQLEYGCSFKEKIVCVDNERIADGKRQERLRAYAQDDFQKLSRELNRAKNNGLIDRIIFPNEIDKRVYQRYFRETNANFHSQNGQPLLMTLNGFECVRTPYVFQTDCDILFHNNRCGSFAEHYLEFMHSKALTMSLSICHEQNSSSKIGERVEVRNCFLNFTLLHQILPFKNSIEQDSFTQTWHRCLDYAIIDKPQLSIRCHNKELYFIHVENKYKDDADMLATVRLAVEKSIVPDVQKGKVNLEGTRADWLPKTDADIVIVSRGKNTSVERIKRMLDSLTKQSTNNFAIVYTDANSTNVSEEYAAYRLKYDKRFEDAVFIPNKTEHLEIDMLMRSVSTIVKQNAIIITVDNDDYLLCPDAVKTIVKKFEDGADYVCGNNIRYDKPLKKYYVSGFEKLWERNGDNIWLHPICFTKELFGKVNSDDMKRDGEWINICTDFAYAVPMIQLANNPQWIDQPIYFFEPSIANQRKEGNYRIEKVNEMRNYILQKAKQRYETDNSSYRR